MKLHFQGLTDTGLVRSANQDAFDIDAEGRFFIVADGMGGHAGGQEASRLATEAIRECLVEQWSSASSSPQLLREAFLRANEAILEDQIVHPERADMGTTAVVVMFRQNPTEPASPDIWCAHVGDSRLYRLRGPKLEQMTEDHTWVAKASKLGVITPDQVKTHPWRHVLSQCLGRSDMAEVEVRPLEVKTGDRLLLCSDGLTEELSDNVIENLLKNIRACDMAATSLIKNAKEHGGRDNITVIVIATETGVSS